MSIKEYYELIGVIHTPDCELCMKIDVKYIPSDDEVVEKRDGIKGLIFIWLLVAGACVAWALYGNVIIGGIK